MMKLLQKNSLRKQILTNKKAMSYMTFIKKFHIYEN